VGRLSHVDESGIALVDISINWQRILNRKGSPDLCLKIVCNLFPHRARNL